MRLAASLALLSREATNVIRGELKLISFGIKNTSCLSPPHPISGVLSSCTVYLWLGCLQGH